MNQTTFRRFCAIAHERAGLCLREGKQNLVASRIAKRIRALSLKGEEDYLHYLESDQSGEELVQFLDVITTNFTSFFREEEHFRIFRQYLDGLAGGNPGRVRIWSAASATGEEPYSIAITLAEALGVGADWRILATDISTRVLGVCREAAYRPQVVEAVPPALRARYFEVLRGATPEALRYRVRPALRSRSTFHRLNLATPPFPMKGPFQVVFCRNVMIYFDAVVRQRLVGEIERLLAPGGLLFIGHAETLTGLDTSLKLVRPAVFEK